MGEEGVGGLASTLRTVGVGFPRGVEVRNGETGVEGHL